MIIDVHTHPPEIRGSSGALDPQASGAELIREMDAYGIAQAGILGWRVIPYQTEEEVREVNDFTREVVQAHPGRFFGFCFVNPNNDPASLRAELDRCLSQPEFSGIKLEMCTNARSHKLDVVMEAAIRHSVPVLHHSWYLNMWELQHCPINARQQHGRSEPHDIADLARRFPEARIIMAHMEGCGVRGILDIAELENVVIDTSGSQPFSGTLEYALEILGSERILFGSDLLGRGLGGQLGRIEGTRLTEEQRQNILLLNACREFSLTSKNCALSK